MFKSKSLIVLIFLGISVINILSAPINLQQGQVFHFNLKSNDSGRYHYEYTDRAGHLTIDYPLLNKNGELTKQAVSQYTGYYEYKPNDNSQTQDNSVKNENQFELDPVGIIDIRLELTTTKNDFAFGPQLAIDSNALKSLIG